MPIPLVDLGELLDARLVTARPELQTVVAPATHPLALFPVRLETRFFEGVGGTTELRVRVYPGAIHLDSHDPALTSEERAAGRAYWEQQWRAADHDERRKLAWEQLADRFEPGRAAWVARALTPLNPDDRPTVALPTDAPLTPPPRFPDLGPPATVTRTPVARLLPSRWTATAYRDGEVLDSATGHDVLPDLAVGPDLRDALAPDLSDHEHPAVDEGMRWMVDFDQAEAAGMGLRLALPVPLDQALVDVLVVSGVHDDRPLDGVTRCADVLDAHRFTDGCEILEPGTPTNNLGDRRSAFSSRDPRGARSFAAEWDAPAARPGDGTSAGHLAVAFGLDQARTAATLGRVTGAAGRDRETAAAMATALWPATWGAYLTQHVGLGRGGLTLEDCDWGREHALRHLVPGGPLPTLRCGRQPYGLLPVTSLGRWSDGSVHAGRLDRVRRILLGLRDQVWRPTQRNVARVGRSDDPSADLVDVLRIDALPSSVRVRRLMGPHYLRHLRLFLGEDLDEEAFWPRLQELTSALPNRIGLGFLPLLGRAVYEGATSLLTAPLVVAGEAADIDSAARVAPAYLGELLAVTDVDGLARPVPDQPVPLLQALLRHGLLREYGQAAARLLAGDDLPVARLLRDAELVDLVPEETPTPSWAWQRDQPVPGSAPPRRVREVLADPEGLPADAGHSLAEFRKALSTLIAADPGTLERHLLDTLATTAYRLDAWFTSFATRRLAELRQERPTGLLVGGYGWVEHLRPDPRRPVAEPLVDEPGSLFEPASDPGFIHAPSLTQASTAALLRNAHLAHGGGNSGPYSIQMTSQRVRTAQRLLNGVRQGQRLGALLGYNVERRLHETGLDDLLDDLRRLAPPPGEAADAAVQRRVLLDGLVLQRRWHDERDSILASLPRLGPETSTRHRRLMAVLTALDLEIDAVADAVTAESAHQMARGNLNRASGTLADIATGDLAPPPLELFRTPRSGLPVTHRVAVVLDAEAGVPPKAGWATYSPRAAADPATNAWMAQLLGPASSVTVAIEVTDMAGATSTKRVRLSELGLAPLDLARLATDESGRHQLAERAYTAAVPADTRHRDVRIDLNLAPPDNRSRRSMSDVLEVASSALALLARARPLDGLDLQPSHADAHPGLDLHEYEQRAAVAHTRLRSVHNSLAAALREGTTPTLSELRDAVLPADGFGVAVSRVPFAIPETGSEPPRPTAAATSIAAGVLAELAQRLAAADEEAAAPDGETEPSRRARLQRRFAAVFGPGFLPLPRFACPDAAGLRASLGEADLLCAGDPTAPYTWWLRMSRLRPGLARLDHVLRLAEATGSAETLELALAQLPHQPGQRWVGLEVPAGEQLRESVASLALHGPGLKRLGRPLAGLLIDEWTEVVPAREETTGIAFRYDPPDATAPQVVLLAVPPVPGEDWTVGTLNQVLLETLDLAHLRAAGPHDLDETGHYLPAALLAFNVDGDVVSTDLNPLAP